AAGIEAIVFSEVKANPTEDNVRQALSVYKDQGCDWLIGLGGGSSIDVAKAVRVMCSHSGQIEDYYAANGGIERITPQMPPLAAIPTTSGTGSEVSPASLLTNTEKKTKLAFFSFFLYPTLAVIDPEMTLACPPALTAASGMDALVHNIEALTAIGDDPLGEATAAWGIKYIAESLRQAVADGSDIEARTRMAYGSYLGGLAPDFNLLGIAHGLSHQISAVFDTPHGVGNAIMIPHVMRFNLASPTAKAKMRWVAAFMGRDVSGLNDGQAAEAAIEAVERLSQKIGIPKGIGQVGVDRDQFELLAEMAMKDVCTHTNPVKVDPAQLVKVLEAAY
ncbi:MAG: iron-containing alcohol dehydrogenase, partial [Deltaproteobacteria bacterium]|nr:iron-containing alcohol dehydrogenase [Deltaproteobacteria bacterium]